MKWLPWALGLALALALAWTSCQSAELRAAAFRADSLEVALDTAKIEAGRTTARLFQVGLERDSLERETKRKPKVVVKVTTVIESLPPDTVPGPVREVAGTRSASFERYREPIRLTASVELPAPPDSGFLAWQAFVDPIRFTARVSCRDRQPVRSAHLSIEGPPWARFVPDSLQQEPDVCNSPGTGVLRISFGSGGMFAAGATAMAAVFLVVKLAF